jgi:hypothetical protein
MPVYSYRKTKSLNDSLTDLIVIEQLLNKKKPALGLRLNPSFRISISEKDIMVLEEIKERIGVGEIYVMRRSRQNKKWADMTQYYVQGLQNLLNVKEFFKKQVFHTTKYEDFQKWAEILEIIESGRHLSKEGFLEIVELREQMNSRLGKTKMRNVDELIELFNPKYKEKTKQTNLIHNLKSGVPLLSDPRDDACDLNE